MKGILFCLAPLIFASSALASDLDNWTIKVRLYRGYPPLPFEALNKIGVMVVEETSKGFLKKSVVYRDNWHPGSTFCMYVDPKLGNAEKVRDDILRRLGELHPRGQFLEFQVENPSNCMKKF